MSQDSVTAHLLGQARFERDGRPVPVAPACARLLAFLLTRPGRRATRATLTTLVSEGAGEQAARRRVNTAVWRLRGVFDEDGSGSTSLIVSDGTGLAISPTCVTWVDVEAFDHGCLVNRPVSEWTADDAGKVRDGLAHYAGEFLEGVYDDWALAERSRLAEVYTSSLLRMVRWHENAGEPETALQYAQTAAAIDPLREDLQRLLMWQYRRAGLPEMAVQHYETCRAVLATELGVEPLPETREAGLGREGATRLPAVLTNRTVRQVLAELESTREELRVIAGHVEHSISALRSQLAGTRGGS